MDVTRYFCRLRNKSLETRPRSVLIKIMFGMLVLLMSNHLYADQIELRLPDGKSLAQLAHDAPARPISINIDFKPTTSLDDIAAMLRKYRLSTLSVDAQRFERSNGGSLEVIVFSNLYAKLTQQLERARCQLQAPSGTFQDNQSNRLIPSDVKKETLPWEFRHALAIISTSQLAALVRDRESPVTDIRFRNFVGSSEYESATKAAVYRLSVKTAAIGFASVPRECEPYLDAVPVTPRPPLSSHK